MIIRISIAALFAILSVGQARAATWVVKPDGLGDFPTIQAALSDSRVVSGDIIELTTGTFVGDGNRDVGFLGKAVTVRSQGGDPSLCIIDCEGSPIAPHRGFRFISGEGNGTRLEGVTIANGVAGLPDDYPPASGGAIACTADPVISRCIFENNSAANGGGAVACALGGSPTIENCVFEGNVAMEGGVGGAIWCYSTSNPTISGCVFWGNSANSGGAIHVTSSSPIIESSVFASNVAQFGGGAVSHGDGGITSVNHCTFYGNEAGAGYAAGIQAAYATVSLDRVILAFSVAGQAAACVESGTIDMNCCDVYGNVGGDWIGCLAGQEDQDGNFSADPLFCGAAVDDYTLDGQSPCLPGNHPDGVDCGLIGALGRGCGAPPAGACCFVDGSCLLLEQTACEDEHGSYQGDWTTCDPNPCPIVLTRKTTWGRIKTEYR